MNKTLSGAPSWRRVSALFLAATAAAGILGATALSVFATPQATDTPSTGVTATQSHDGEQFVAIKWHVKPAITITLPDGTTITPTTSPPGQNR